MRRALVFLVLFICGSPLLALEVFPPAPDSHTFIKVLTQSGFCPGSIDHIDVAVNAPTITATVIPKPDVSCIAILFPLQVDLGVIPPGVWNVVLRVQGGQPFEQSKIIVRDAGSGIIVSPVGGRTEGGRSVQVFGASSGSVLFDGVPATDAHFENGSLVVTPPPHAAGTVDVTVTDSTGTRKAVAAFTYFDPDAAPDPFVFEPLLYPVAYDGPGAGGAQWGTDNLLGTGLTLARFRASIPARTCSNTCSQFNWSAVLSDQSPSGLLLWAVRRRLPLGVADDLRVASRVADLRQPHGFGTNLPVGRERDFRNHFTIDAVPVGDGARTTLRLYSLSQAPQTAMVTINFGDGSSQVRTVTLQPLGSVDFASLDIAGPGRASISVSSPKTWGLATVTDNVTQQVTAYWPQ
jgi:hypothetical protein